MRPLFTESSSRGAPEPTTTPVSSDAIAESTTSGGTGTNHRCRAHSGEFMRVTNRREQAAVLSLVSQTDAEWHRLASFIEEIGSAERILSKAWSGFESFDFITKDEAEHLADRITRDHLDRYHQLVDDLAEDGVALLTVLDDDYPSNLRLVFNRPPFLFVRGRLEEVDSHAIAIVGTRAASQEGLDQAGRLARDLAAAGVTVVSGLALGIDAAAHAASLDSGGRTIAVLGSGMRRPVYPKANAPLAERIVASGGALVSQFWPDHPPSPSSFPMRNVVTSGMAVGTVVIEASSTSGAKNQARRALEHGKRLFLVESLVMHEQWARDYAERPGVTVVQSVDDILDVLVAMAKPPEQLSLN